MPTTLFKSGGAMLLFACEALLLGLVLWSPAGALAQATIRPFPLFIIGYYLASIAITLVLAHSLLVRFQLTGNVQLGWISGAFTYQLPFYLVEAAQMLRPDVFGDARLLGLDNGLAVFSEMGFALWLLVVWLALQGTPNEGKPKPHPFFYLFWPGTLGAMVVWTLIGHPGLAQARWVLDGLLVANLLSLMVAVQLWHRQQLSVWFICCLLAQAIKMLFVVHPLTNSPYMTELVFGQSLLGRLLFLGANYEALTALFQDMQSSNRVLSAQALTDALTGLYNRRYLAQTLEAELYRARREAYPLSLLMVDIDYFKRFNDQFGHPAGDACLQQVAQALQAQLTRRGGDFVVRYGGEEFTVVLPGTDKAGAAHLAEVARRAVTALPLQMPDGQPVSISVGVATWTVEAPCSGKELIARADTLLYRAKKNGRNRIEQGFVQVQPRLAPLV